MHLYCFFFFSTQNSLAQQHVSTSSAHGCRVSVKTLLSLFLWLPISHLKTRTLCHIHSWAHAKCVCSPGATITPSAANGGENALQRIVDRTWSQRTITFYPVRRGGGVVSLSLSLSWPLSLIVRIYTTYVYQLHIVIANMWRRVVCCVRYVRVPFVTRYEHFNSTSFLVNAAFHSAQPFGTIAARERAHTQK